MKKIFLYSFFVIMKITASDQPSNNNLDYFTMLNQQFMQQVEEWNDRGIEMPNNTEKYKNPIAKNITINDPKVQNELALFEQQIKLVRKQHKKQ